MDVAPNVGEAVVDMHVPEVGDGKLEAWLEENGVGVNYVEVEQIDR